jgi:hypothetical protein
VRIEKRKKAAKNLLAGLTGISFGDGFEPLFQASTMNPLHGTGAEARTQPFVLEIAG